MNCAGRRFGGRPVAQQPGRVASGSPWSWAAHRGASGRHDWPTVAQKQKARRGRSRAARKDAFDATG